MTNGHSYKHLTNPGNFYSFSSSETSKVAERGASRASWQLDRGED